MSLIPYTAPAWCQGLKNIPEAFIKLAHRPTPIQKLNIPEIHGKFELYLKRDDFTGSSLSGNKVRKLEFLMADAIRHGSHHIITCGSLQSNHCRAVAAACAQLNLKSHLFLRTDHQVPSAVDIDGNILLNKLFGADMYLIPRKSPYVTHIRPKMESLSARIREEDGSKSYLIPVGGSDAIGVWGYIECFSEIMQQDVEVDDIVCVCGSGGTAAGLAIANYLNGSPVRCHGISVCDSRTYFHQHINEVLRSLGISDVVSEDIITIHDDYRGLGYGVNQSVELDFIADIARRVGLLLDNVYTGKAFRGVIDLMNIHPRQFKGNRVLFIHSGGAASLHSKSVSQAIISHTSQGMIQTWKHS